MDSPEPTPPEPPDFSMASVHALVEYAEAQTEFWQWHLEWSRRLGKQPGEQAVLNVDGWRFVATALAESYDD